MSKLYPVPAKAIKDISELEVGMLIWSAGAGGVSGPSASELPKKFQSFCKDNEFISTIYQKEVDGKYVDEFVGDKLFLSEVSIQDRNIGTINKYNDWYLFKTKEDAEEAVAEMLKIRESDPKCVESEEAHREWCNEFLNDDFYCDVDFHDYDYEMGYDDCEDYDMVYDDDYED